MPEITVRGMSCGHCAEAVTKALKSLPGVSRVQVDLARVIHAAGYEVVPG